MNEWPEWGVDLVWTAATVGVVYLVGYTLRVVFGNRIARTVGRTTSKWDDQLVREVTRRLPLWSLLVGLHLSLPRWSLPATTADLINLVLSAVGVASVTILAGTVLSRAAVDYGAREAVPISALTQNLVRIAVTILGALVIVRSFGYDIAPMLTVLGVGGLTVALALQEPLSNLFAGLFVSLAGQVRIGDYVRLDNGAEGQVADLNWRSTLLRQGTGNIIEVPNSKLAQAIVTNFSQPGPETALVIDLIVEHASDLDLVEREAMTAAIAVVAATPGVVRERPPTVLFGAVSDTGITVSVTVRVRSYADRGPVRHQLIKALHAAFDRAGILLAQRPVQARSARPA